MVAAHRFMAELQPPGSSDRPTRGPWSCTSRPTPTSTRRSSRPALERARRRAGGAERSRRPRSSPTSRWPRTAGQRRLAPAERGPDLRSLAPRRRDGAEPVGGVAGLLGRPASRHRWTTSLLMSTGSPRPTATDGLRRSGRGRAQNVAGAVILPDEFRITLTTRSTTIPVHLSNNTEQLCQVRVELDSDQLEFPDGDVLDTTLPPGTTRFEVPSAPARPVPSPSTSRSRAPTTRSCSTARPSTSGRPPSRASVCSCRSAPACSWPIWWGRHWRRTRRAAARRGPAAVTRGRRPRRRPGTGPGHGRPHHLDPCAVGGAIVAPPPPPARGRTERTRPPAWGSGSDGGGRSERTAPRRAVPARPHGPLPEPQQHAAPTRHLATPAVGTGPHSCRACTPAGHTTSRQRPCPSASSPTPPPTCRPTRPHASASRSCRCRSASGPRSTPTASTSRSPSSTRSWRRPTTLPETAAPSPGAFEAAFRRQAEAGADAVVCINLSEGLSATIQSAQNAATAVEGDARRPGRRLPVDHLRPRHPGDASPPTAAADGAERRRGRGPGRGPVPRTHVSARSTRSRTSRRAAASAAPRRCSARCCRSSRCSTSRPARSPRRARPAPAARRSSGSATRSSPARRSSTCAVAHGMAPDVDDMLDLLAPRYPRGQDPGHDDRRHHRHPRRPPGHGPHLGRSGMTARRRPRRPLTAASGTLR